MRSTNVWNDVVWFDPTGDRWERTVARAAVVRPTATMDRMIGAHGMPEPERGLSGRVRRLLVDSPHSVGARRRAARWDLFCRLFPAITDMRVVDLGGTVEAWRRAPVRPASVTVVNLFEPGESGDGRLVPVMGDACQARSALNAAGAEDRYDLVFSNSLLEHVGGHARRVALAGEIHALAPRHWVQTPYRYFPVEPHWLFPGLQFLPLAARTRIAAAWPLAHTRPEDRATAMSEVQWTELVGIAEMRSYFPHSEIHKEKFAGLTKSLVAVTQGLPPMTEREAGEFTG